MKSLRIVVALILVLGIASVPVNAGSGARSSNIARLDLMVFPGIGTFWPPAPPEYAGAGGRVKYTLSGPILEFTLKAHGLVPGMEYHVYGCGDIGGAGVADRWGNMTVVGSMSGKHHDIKPEDYFSVHLVDDWLSIVLWSEPHGYTWE